MRANVAQRHDQPVIQMTAAEYERMRAVAGQPAKVGLSRFAKFMIMAAVLPIALAIISVAVSVPYLASELAESLRQANQISLAAIEASRVPPASSMSAIEAAAVGGLVVVGLVLFVKGLR